MILTYEDERQKYEIFNNITISELVLTLTVMTHKENQQLGLINIKLKNLMKLCGITFDPDKFLLT